MMPGIANIECSLDYKDYLALNLMADSICPICRNNKATTVDYDCTTNKPRGLICRQCSAGLNLVEDKTALGRALLYLKGAL
jgi:hypothetical protein